MASSTGRFPSIFWLRDSENDLFFRKTVEIEDFAVKAAILNKRQIYLEGGGRFSRVSAPTAINHDASSLGEWLSLEWIPQSQIVIFNQNTW